MAARSNLDKSKASEMRAEIPQGPAAVWDLPHILTGWCGQEDSNFHGLSATTTSTLRVYQFRHGRTTILFGTRPRPVELRD